MAVNAYLYVEGIEGASPGRQKCIDVMDVEWGVAASRNLSVRKAELTGLPDFSRLTITKLIDQTSPQLTNLLYTNVLLPAVYVVYEKPVGDLQRGFFRLWLRNAHVA